MHIVVGLKYGAGWWGSHMGQGKCSGGDVAEMEGEAGKGGVAEMVVKAGVYDGGSMAAHYIISQVFGCMCSDIVHLLLEDGVAEGGEIEPPAPPASIAL